jgi:DNA-binding HxlR family transcriptional regulator
MSLKSSILYLIKSQGEVSFGELYALANDVSRKPDNLTRRCRELTADGFIEPIKEKNRDGIDYISGYRSTSSL